MDFNRGARYISDDGEAEELNKSHGLKGSGEVWVHEDPVLEWSLKHDGETDGHNLTIHNYTFQGVDKSKLGGNDRVKVRTEDGYTFISRAIAEEEGLEIIPKRRRVRRKDAEVKDGSDP